MSVSGAKSRDQVLQERAPAARQPAAPRAAANNADGGPSHSINGVVAGGVWWLLNKYAGDFLSWFSRYLYNIFCEWLIGGATGISGKIKWFLVCMSPGEQTSRYAYNNSQQIVNVGLALLAYWGAHRFQRFWYKAGEIVQAGANIVDHEVMRRLDSLHHQVDQMAQAQQELRSSVEGSSQRLTPLRDSQESSPPLVRAQQAPQPSQDSGDRDALRRTNTGTGKV